MILLTEFSSIASSLIKKSSFGLRVELILYCSSDGCLAIASFKSSGLSLASKD